MLAAMTVVNTTERGHSLTVTVAAVTQTVPVQLRQCRVIGITALTLIEQIAIPEQAMRFQLFEDGVSGAGYFSRGVYIFDSNQPLALMMTRIEKTGESTD
jgi:hypothetical protein